MKKFFKILFFSLLTVILAGSIIFLIYANIYYHADGVDDYLKSDDYVTVTETNEYIAFMPNEGSATTGFIFYPGAKVEEKAYAEMMYDLAKLNVFACIVKMPLRFAFFNIHAANKIVDEFDDKVDYFYIGGHSLGGSMASKHLEMYDYKYQGIVFLGSYSCIDLTQKSVWALSIYGSNDYVLNRNSYAKAQEKMPERSFEYVIDGGNHANYASYGAQKGDGEATISRSSQINLTVLKIVEFITLKQLTLVI